GRRRTGSRDRSSCSVSLTIAPANNSRVQRTRPSGGFEQAVATSSASSLPVSLRAAPGRGSSLSAASRLPSTKRRLVRYIVDPAMARLVAIASSLTPESAASRDLRPLQLARRVLATAQQRGQRLALALVQLDPVTYIHRCPPAVEGTTDESGTRPVSPLFPTRLHIQAGPILSLYLRLYSGGRSAPGHVSPPAVHQMILTLERGGLIRRQPGVARSIEVLVDPDALPTLRANNEQPV